MSDKIIYLDNAATTFPFKEVLDTFNKYVTQYPGNPGSIHKLGQEATRVIDKARNLIIKTLNLDDYDVIFTSGATESDNLAIKGVCHKYNNRGKHIIVSSVEHPAVLEVARNLEIHGYRVTYLPVNSEGVVEPETLENAICDDTILVSIMSVNNENGAVNNVHELSNVIRKYPKIIFHVDAVQSLGKIPFDMNDADLITITGHKIHGLIGCGCLLKKSKINILPVFNGGGQQIGLRSGTESLPLSVSFAVAIKHAVENQENEYNTCYKFAEKLTKYLEENKDLYEINSNYKNNPFIVNFSLKTKKASVVVEALSEENIFVSSISACHSKGEPISYVVMEQKHNETFAHNTIRVSFSVSNTMEDVETFISELDRIVKSIKQ